MRGKLRYHITDVPGTWVLVAQNHRTHELGLEPDDEESNVVAGLSADGLVWVQRRNCRLITTEPQEERLL